MTSQFLKICKTAGKIVPIFIRDQIGLRMCVISLNAFPASLERISSSP